MQRQYDSDDTPSESRILI